MSGEVKKEKGKMLLKLFVAAVVAAVITGSCYNSWHSKADIYLTFEAQNERGIEYSVYYTENTKDVFSRKRVEKQKIAAGSHRVEVVLPAKKIARLRLDLGMKPGTVFISDLRLEGNKTLNLDKYSKYKFNKQVDEHEITESGGLRIISEKNNPYMIITGDIDVTQKDVYDQNKIWTIFGTSFLIIFALLMLIKRKSK